MPAALSSVAMVAFVETLASRATAMPATSNEASPRLAPVPFVEQPAKTIATNNPIAAMCLIERNFMPTSLRKILDPLLVA
jgi:hypothetical protein